MSTTFTKLFSSITESTVWCEPSDIRIVWITMLAMADKHGRVWGSIPGLAHRAQVPVAAARQALKTFLEPDPDSRTKDHEGRRIKEIDGGWALLNHGKYRKIQDEEGRRAYKAEHEKKRRAEGKVPKRGQKSGQNGYSVDSGGQCMEENGHKADADTEAISTVSKTSSSHPGGAGDVSTPAKHPDLIIYEAYPRQEGRAAALTAIAKAVKRILGGEAGPELTDATVARRWLWKITATYARSPVGSNPDKTKIPHPSTWFNQSRYLDDQTNWKQTGDQRPHGKLPFGQTQTKSERTIDAARDAVQDIADRLGLSQNGGS